MLVLAVLIDKKIPKIENSVILTFDEMFEKYKQNCKKSFWRTQEGMFLEWLNCDSIKRMKQCLFVYPGNEDITIMIRNKYSVIDENNLNY